MQTAMSRTAVILVMSAVFLWAPAPVLRSAEIEPAETPYVPLFTEPLSLDEARAHNTAQDAEHLQQWYVHVRSNQLDEWPLGLSSVVQQGDTSLAAKLSQAGLWVSQLRSGSQTSSATSGKTNFLEARDLESTAPLAIATFWPGNRLEEPGNDAHSAARLSVAIGATDKTLRITNASSLKPSGAPDTWPYVNSRGAGLVQGAFSTNTRDFVSWIRVDNELMKIVQGPVLSNGKVVLSVQRGIFGTQAAPHTAKSRVFSPVYHHPPLGPELAGSPAVNDPKRPLRYTLKIWQPNAQAWIARRIRATFGGPGQGYNAAAMDYSRCYTHADRDASAHFVRAWDDPQGTRLTNKRWGEAQRIKTAGLRTQLPGFKFTGQNLALNSDACTDTLAAEAFDAGLLDHWAKMGFPWRLTFEQMLEQHLRIQANRWPAIYRISWLSPVPQLYDPAAGAARYKRFSYGTLLLGYEPAATTSQYGGPFGLAKPDPLFFWDWGVPLHHPSTLADLRVPNSGLYRREFSHGLILVNPTPQNQFYALGKTLYDVSQGAPVPVTSVTVGVHDAVFLFQLPVDQTPPTVQLMTPVDGTTVAGSDVEVLAEAGDHKQLADVEFFADGLSFGTVAEAPYRVLFDTTGKPNGPCVLKAVAHDAAGNSAFDEVTVQITNPYAPELTAVDDQVVAEGDPLALQFSATDPNGDPVTFVVDGLPAGATLVGGLLSWTPTFEQAGLYPMTVTASDGSLTDSDAFQVTVTDVNRPPTLTPLPSQGTLLVGEVMSGTLTGADPDGDGLHFDLRMASGDPLPAGLTITDSGVLQWAPSAQQVGDYLFLAEVSDGRGGTDSQLLTRLVRLNQPPVVTFVNLVDESEITASEDHSVLISAIDTDGSVKKVELYSGDALVGIDTIAPYEFSAADLPLGNHTLTARATDNLGATAQVSIKVHVRLKDK